MINMKISAVMEIIYGNYGILSLIDAIQDPLPQRLLPSQCLWYEGLTISGIPQEYLYTLCQKPLCRLTINIISYRYH